MDATEVTMRLMFMAPILSAIALGCEAKHEHGFVSAGGDPGPGAGGTVIDAWGGCEEEPKADLASDAVVQAVPPPAAKNVSVHTPILTFLEEGYTLDDIERFDVSSNGWKVEGDIVALDRGDTSVLAFAPVDPYEVAGEVRVRIEAPGGPVEWAFHTGPYESTMAGQPNLSFENTVVPQGIECEYTFFTDNFIGFGDVAITDEEAGPTAATDGMSRLLMTTGEVLGNASVRGTSSFVTSQPMPVIDDPVLSFDYRFVSEEFDENVGAVHDDSFLVVAHGRAGVVFEEVTSVNRIGIEDSSDVSFPGLLGAEANEWQTHRVTDFNTLGADSTISLFITDVGSTVRTSAVSVDHLRVE